MAQVQRTTITLRFNGEDLDPQELSDRLGATPTRAFVKGATLPSASGSDRIAKTGQWLLTLEGEAPDDFEKLVTRLFHRLSTDRDTWLDLSKRFAGELFVGFFLGSSNEGVPVGHEALREIVARGLGLGVDIYGATEA